MDFVRLYVCDPKKVLYVPSDTFSGFLNTVLKIQSCEHACRCMAAQEGQCHCSVGVWPQLCKQGEAIGTESHSACDTCSHPDNPSSVPETHMEVEGETSPTELPSDLQVDTVEC